MNEEPFPKLAEPEESTAPGTPPSPPELSAGTSQDVQVSRKREREVSLEPAVPLADFDSARKDKQNAKKNRLDPTLEESDSGPIRPDSPSPSILQTSEATPQLAMSPPHETKMHHISRRVEHIGWKNGGGQSATPETALEPSLSRERSDHSLPSLPREPPSTSTKEPEAPRRSSMESIIDTGISPAIPPPETPSAITTPPEERTVEAILEPGVAKRRSVDSVVSTSGTKRPREDDEKDENPRETKRPSPPPEKEKEKAEMKPIPPSTPSKFGGFMSYASTASPFSSVKGNNVFKSKPSSFEPMPSPFSSNPNNLGSQTAPSSPPKDEPNALKRNAATSSSDPPSPKGESGPSKRNAFTAFASAASPFASAAAKRAKSPSVSGDRDRPAFGMGSPFARATRGTERAKSPTRRAGSATANAFTTYASGGATGFGSPFGTPVASRAPVRASSLDSGRKEEASKKSGSGSEGSEEEAEEEEERGKVSFGDRLRAQTNEEAEEERGKLELTEQEVTTGEEEEETLYQVRGKLFQLSDANQWRERGTGALKLNVRQADGDGARLVMRKEAVHTLILNVPLFKGMVISLAQDPRYIRFSTIEDGNTVHYNLRVSSAKVAQELLDEVTSNIPSA